MNVTWRQIALILFLEALIDVLLDKFVKGPAMRLWDRFLDWAREGMRHGKEEEGETRHR